MAKLKRSRGSKSSTNKARHFLKSVFQSNRALQMAHEKAITRFRDLPGVSGIGIGRRFIEKHGRYTSPKKPGKYGLKIFVKQKIRKPKPSERIPRWFVVKPAGAKRARRIEIDVVSTATGKGVRGRGGLNDGRGWPTSGAINPGCLFAVTKEGVEVGNAPAGFGANDAEVGTTGAVVNITATNQLFAVTASHVFLNLLAKETTAPIEPRAVGVLKNKWAVVGPSLYRPLHVDIEDTIRDALSFELPQALAPANFTWPPGFKGNLASDEDRHNAALSKDPLAFAWVQRSGTSPVKLPLNLDAFVDPIALPLECGTENTEASFVQAWRLIFVTDSAGQLQTTIGGDSGAGVFVQASDDASECRLLGFHFYESCDSTHSFATDARWFFEASFGSDFGSSFKLPV